MGSPQREAHPCLGQQVPLPPVLELLFHLLCSDLEVDVPILWFLCIFNLFCSGLYHVLKCLSAGLSRLSLEVPFTIHVCALATKTYKS